MNDTKSETMPGQAGKTKLEAQVSTSAGVERIRITRTAWRKTHKDFKGWYDFNDGRGRVRCILTCGPHGTTLAPVQIIPDEEG